MVAHREFLVDITRRSFLALGNAAETCAGL